ncbi:MAG: arylesterase [Polymorphobacter sp.]|uniref:arylesterase n=1 Tax=Polymorphobacter sp. TaxID=1909290 RepID=UPI003A8412A8
MSSWFYQFVGGLLLMLLPIAAQAATPKTILAYGDSLTAGYQLKPGEGFAPQLEAALRARGHDVKVVMGGVSGDTTAQGRARIGWTLGAMKSPPDLVVLELGANDMLRGQSPATARANLDAMIADFKARGSRVVLAGMLAQPNLGAAYVKEFNAIYPSLAKKHQVALYPFFMDGVATVKGLQLDDGLHPTAEGVKVIVRRILPLVEKELAKSG